MACDEYKDLMMGYLDNELTPDQRTKFEEHIASHPECAAEFEEFKQLQKITDGISLAEPEDKVWDQYWSGVYNRTERGIGWIVFSVSAILLLIYGGFKLIEAIVTDPCADIILKAGLIALIIGLAILLVSVFREKMFFQKKDRYKDVRR